MIEPPEDVLVTREQRGQIAILTMGYLCSSRKSQRGSKLPNPPCHHGSRRRSRTSVEPDGRASSSSMFSNDRGEA